MKIIDKTRNETKTASNAVLKSIELYTKQTAHGKSDIIVVNTDIGNFSNFRSIFDKQHLDVESLNAGDVFDITYVVYDAPNGATFKNFLTIKKVV